MNTAPLSATTVDRSAAPWGRPSWGLIGFLLAVGLLVPWVLIRAGGGSFILHLVITFFIWAVVAQAWNLVLGVSGIYSFAQIALFAIGGWTTGVLSVHFGWNPWVSVLLAPVAATVAALLIGLPMLRLRGIYVVLLTLAFHELLRNYLTNGPRIFSGGGYGLKTVPRFRFGGVIGDTRQVLYFYVAMLLFALATYAIWRIFRSPVGMAFQALRDSETYAVSRGVDQFRMKLFLFGFSAFFTGLAGGVMTHYLGSISTSLFSFSLLINLLAMIVIGGWGSFGGPIVGAALLIALQEWLRDLADLRTLALGLTLAAIAVLAPQGIFPLVRDRISRFMAGLDQEMAIPEAGQAEEEPALESESEPARQASS